MVLHRKGFIVRTALIAGETLVAFKQGRKLGVHGGMVPTARSLQRWATKGINGKVDEDGTPITLEHCYIGARLYTSVEAFQRWLEKINRV